MEKNIKEKIKNILLLKTIRSKIIITYIIFATVILFFMTLAVNRTITRLEENLIASRLESDINYIEDLISGYDKNSSWNIKDDAIYFGNVLIGDGTEETANLTPFLEHEKKTKTFAYVFMLDKDAKLGYVEETETSEGYYEGHYLRVAGSTRSPEGKSIVGTYISKNVSDALDKNGYFSGEANVAGGLIFCLYNVLENKEGEVIGAIVVGRNITELKAQISASVNNITFFMIFIVLSCCIIISVLISRWISSIGIITGYLRELENGVIPKHSLELKTRDEMILISESINKMVCSMKENIVLRNKSETDALTGLPNRFAYDYYSRALYNRLLQESDYLAVEIMDIDFFKEYNDNYGHQAGDKCIRSIAKVLKRLCSEYCNIFCCRYGGDEFIMIYNGYTKQEIEAFLKLLKEEIMACKIKHEYSSVSDIVTISQGACFGYFKPEYAISTFFNKADKALYEVKKIHRNHYGIIEL